ncbi:hypothetical protein CYMTET_34009, partial [Cymbomonas tetramitiformis]
LSGVMWGARVRELINGMPDVAMVKELQLYPCRKMLPVAVPLHSHVLLGEASARSDKLLQCGKDLMEYMRTSAKLSSTRLYIDTLLAVHYPRGILISQLRPAVQAHPFKFDVDVEHFGYSRLIDFLRSEMADVVEVCKPGGPFKAPYVKLIDL